ncbi:hypothetical protein [Chiayiivirga flava]|uniref:Dicarboxylate transport domain-containing protein n=1 Tax=Chiayiivirga flava TaxID=659595 RepID=A0A7W8D5K0_9GAMM|nr:hypothetical protein [Chiayiivirga flava]MBB5207122.1 hypothetical protein [Chiayiivirga flava]
MRKFVVRGMLPLVAALVSPAHARVAEMQVDTLVTPLATAEGISVRLQWPDGRDSGDLVLQAKRLVIGESGYAFRNLRWTCTATRTAPERLACDGELRAANAPASSLRAQWTAGQLELQLTQAKSTVGLVGPARAASPTVDAASARTVPSGSTTPSAGNASDWTVAVARMPAAWLAPLLAGLWPDGSITGGTVDATWSVGTRSDGTLVAGGPLAVAGLGIDTADGTLAAASLDAGGRVHLQWGATTRIDADLAVRGGELLAGAVYANLPETPIDVGWTLAGSGTAWALERAVWSDPGVFDVQATAALDTEADAALRALDARFAVPDAALATPRYFESLLGSVGLAGLRARGALRGRVLLDAGGLRQLELAPSALDLDDADRRFGVEGLDGTLRLTAADGDSTLGWRAAHVHGIALGATRLALRSGGMGLALAQPATIPALGGSIVLPKFSWRRAADAGESAAFDLALTLRDIDLRQLSAALGWPAFSGTLSGDIPGVRYADSVIDLQGGLTLRLFDGSMRIDALTLERPFGVAPTMTAAIAFDNLDLKPLTGAFGFGEITGRLGGHVRGLRLVDWTPVAFDARFETSTSAKDPRRISQRAVRDLTEVGGGGIAAGLQAQVLKVFQTFGYARIGLSCTLANDVCRMGGLDGGDGGYTIVEGAGLPRVTVVGHQRQVDWPVLVARLKAATEGQAPIID